jgi:hypothetical protein
MDLLEVPVPRLHPAPGAAAWAFFLVGIACAVVLSAGYLARIWRGNRSHGQIRSRSTAPEVTYRNQRHERVSGGSVPPLAPTTPADEASPATGVVES